MVPLGDVEAETISVLSMKCFLTAHDPFGISPFTIFVFLGVLFLGGAGCRRAPWSPCDGSPKESQFSEFTGVWQWGIAGGHCPTETSESRAHDLLTSRQSVKGEVKALTSRIPDTKNSGTAGPSDEESAWKTKKARKESVNESTTRMLMQAAGRYLSYKNSKLFE